MTLFATILGAVAGGLLIHQYITLPLMTFLEDTVAVVKERRRK